MTQNNEAKSSLAKNDLLSAIIFSGWGLSCYEWEFFTKDASDFANIITYDRKGYGITPEGIYPRNCTYIAHDIADFLSQNDISGEVVIIAHDAGAIYARVFLHYFPEKVAGIVFVDPLTEFEDEFYLLNAPKYFASASNHARMGMMRRLMLTDQLMHRKMLEPMMEIFYSKYSFDARDAILNHAISKTMIRTLLSEYDSRHESYEILKNMPQSNIPVQIIYRDPQMMAIVSEQFGVPRNESMIVEEMWQSHISRLKYKFPNSKLIEAKGCDHSIHIADHSVVVRALRDLTESL